MYFKKIILMCVIITSLIFPVSAAVNTVFSATPVLGTTPLTVVFTDLSTGDPTNWSWTFGDGNISNAKNPLFTYNISGVYKVILNASDATTFSNYSLNITVLAAYPNASFTASTIYGSAPLNVYFTDTSSVYGNITYLWNFGDGTNSTVQNPLHQYSASGDYIVTLTVTDDIGIDTSDITIIHVSSTLYPFVNFIANTTSGSSPLSVSFSDLTTNINLSLSTWNWSFGDGTFSNSQNPTHIYSTNGQYTVRLIVVNNSVSNYTIKTGYITVGISSGSVYANFVASPVYSATTPLTVHFTDSSICTPVCNDWQWDLNGDGSIESTTQNPDYIYTYQGNYSPTLTVSNGVNSGARTRIHYITVGPIFVPTTIPQPTQAWNPSYNGGIFKLQGDTSIDMANSTYLKYWLQNFTATGNFSVYGFAVGLLAPIMHIFGFWIFLILWLLYLFAVWIRSQDTTLPLIIGLLTIGTFGLLFPKQAFYVILIMLAVCAAIIIYRVVRE